MEEFNRDFLINGHRINFMRIDPWSLLLAKYRSSQVNPRQIYDRLQQDEIIQRVLVAWDKQSEYSHILLVERTYPDMKTVTMFCSINTVRALFQMLEKDNAVTINWKKEGF